MAKTEKDYEDLLKLFNKHRVKYCVVGAYAVAFHAIPRYTKDMDIFVEANPQNAQKIVQALSDFGFSGLRLKARDFSKPAKTVQLGYEPVRVDLLTVIDGRTFAQVWKHKKSGCYGETKAYFISADDLIANKKASGRKQDQIDIEILKKPRR